MHCVDTAWLSIITSGCELCVQLFPTKPYTPSQGIITEKSKMLEIVLSDTGCSIKRNQIRKGKLSPNSNDQQDLESRPKLQNWKLRCRSESKSQTRNGWLHEAGQGWVGLGQKGQEEEVLRQRDHVAWPKVSKVSLENEEENAKSRIFLSWASSLWKFPTSLMPPRQHLRALHLLKQEWWGFAPSPSQGSKEHWRGKSGHLKTKLFGPKRNIKVSWIRIQPTSRKHHGVTQSLWNLDSWAHRIWSDPHCVPYTLLTTPRCPEPC